MIFFFFSNIHVHLSRSVCLFVGCKWSNQALVMADNKFILKLVTVQITIATACKLQKMEWKRKRSTKKRGTKDTQPYSAQRTKEVGSDNNFFLFLILFNIFKRNQEFYVRFFSVLCLHLIATIFLCVYLIHSSFRRRLKFNVYLCHTCLMCRLDPGRLCI